MSTNREPGTHATSLAFLSGGGEMGQRIRDLDWTQTPLGPPAEWPQSLQTAVALILNASDPLAVYWGNQLILLYNDRWRRLIGDKHPHALGQPGREVFREIWETVGPQMAAVMAGEGAVSGEAHLLPLNRRGAPEDAWFDYSFNPLPRRDGTVGGIFNIATEVTRRVRAEAGRDASEAYLQEASRAAQFGVYARDLLSGQDYWSPEFLAIYGLEPDESLPIVERIPAAVHPDDREQVLAEAQLRLERRADPSFSSEHRVIRPDGEVRWVLVQGRVTFDDEGRPVATHGIVMDISEHKLAEEALRESEARYRKLAETLEERVEERAQQVQELAAQLTMAEHEERGRIAQVLHDDLQQQLYALQIQLQFLHAEAAAMAHGEALLREIAAMEEGVKVATETTRQLSISLSPPILEGEGLVEAISWLATQMREQYGLKITMEARGHTSSREEASSRREAPFLVPAQDRRVLLFQTVRELLFNVVKHTGVNEVTLTLQELDDSEHDRTYRIDVVDEGPGFDPQAVLAPSSSASGRGLLHARQRLQLAGGHLEIQSAPGRGTRVTIIAPARSTGGG